MSIRRSFCPLILTFLALFLPAPWASAWQFESSGYSSEGALSQVITPAGDTIIVGDNVVNVGDASSAFTVIKVSGSSGTEIWRRQVQAPNWVAGSARDVALDSAGNIFAVGTLDRAFVASSAANSHFIVIKIDGTTGSELWRMVLGDPYPTGIARSVALDTVGNPVVAGTIVATPAGGLDFAVIKFDGTTGLELWRQVIDTGNTDRAWDVTVDSLGDVVAAGRVSLGDPTQPRIAVMKFDGTTGGEIWRVIDTDLMVHGGGAFDATPDVTTDVGGDIIVTGSVALSGYNAILVLKLDRLSGTEIWRQHPGIPGGRNLSHAVATDPSGNVIVGGEIQDTSRPGFGVIKLAGIDGSELWRWVEASGMSLFSNARAVALDSAGDVIAAGEGFSLSGVTYLAVRKVSGVSGALLWTQYGWEGEFPRGQSVKLDGAGNIFVAGKDPPETMAVLKLLGSDGSGFNCGNGVIDPTEACDDGNTQSGDCCSALCLVEPATQVCRASGGVCDPAEFCDGSSVVCPADVRSTAECRPTAGPCDLSEVCDGMNVDCPADVLSTAECRSSQGVCDLAEFCDGVNVTCPVDQMSTSECRPAAGACDLPEFCSGFDLSCPADSKSTNSCRASAGACDLEDFCDGVSNTCPSDLKKTGLCRGAFGPCDLPEFCDGVSDTCPDPAGAKRTDVCRPAAGPCDLPENCDGVSDFCPADFVAAVGTLCRAAAGECDLPEVCTGSGRFCPMDVFAVEGTSCLEDGNLCTTDQCSAAGNCDHLLTPNPCESVAIPADPNASADLLGGAGVVDGVSAAFDSVTTSGEMAAELFLCAPSDSACLAGVALDPAPSEFRLAGDPIQSWEIEFTGSFSGNLTLIFHYDAASLDPNQNEADLRVLHFSNGVWTAVPGQVVDPIANTIQLTVQSLSPFALGRVRDPVPFVAYKVRGTKGVTRFARLGPVTLGDVLGPVDYSLRKPVTLGLPAREAGDAVPLGSIHLEEYRIKAEKGTPKFVRLSGVHVTNTCNDLYLELIKPASLLVPTAKSLSGPVAPPDGDTHGLDHFVCYKARPQKKLADGTPLAKFPRGLQMELEDQFQSRRYDLKKVTRLCVPTAKSGDPLFLSGPQKGTPVGLAPATVRNPDAMLLCYGAKQARKRIAQAGCGPIDPSDAGSPIAPSQQKHMRRSGIHTANQLGSEQLDTIKEFEVCLPTSATFPAP